MTAFARAIRRTAILVSVLVMVGGCAFGTRQPTLIYPPGGEAADASNRAVKASPKHIEIVLNPFTDQRTDKKVVGTVRNGFGMRTADVIPTNSVDGWVTEAVRQELVKDGYEVRTEPPASDNRAARQIVVSGEILNVFCDMYFSYTGQVSLLVQVTRDGKDILHKHYSGEGSAGLAVAMTSEAYANSLALALSSSLKQFIADLSQLKLNE